MSRASVRHPVFARFLARRAAKEPPEMTDHRRRLLAGLGGRVLEVGAASGINFALYPRTVSEVVAVEPEPYLRVRATNAAARANVHVTVLDGTAEALPAASNSFDGVVVCLVLCSVHDQRTALDEIRRVLRPGGQLRFYEHVLADAPWVANAQRVLDRVLWPRIFGNCHTARDTHAAIINAGFEVEAHEKVWLAPRQAMVPLAPHVLGSATRP